MTNMESLLRKLRRHEVLTEDLDAAADHIERLIALADQRQRDNASLIERLAKLQRSSDEPNSLEDDVETFL